MIIHRYTYFRLYTRDLFTSYIYTATIHNIHNKLLYVCIKLLGKYNMQYIIHVVQKKSIFKHEQHRNKRNL